MNTALVTCPRCNGTGRYNAPTRYGPDCFRCNGTGKTRPTRETAPKAHVWTERDDYVNLGDFLSAQAREYIGLRWNVLQVRSAELAYARGCREIRRDAIYGTSGGYTPKPELPRYR